MAEYSYDLLIEDDNEPGSSQGTVPFLLHESLDHPSYRFVNIDQSIIDGLIYHGLDEGITVLNRSDISDVALRRQKLGSLITFFLGGYEYHLTREYYQREVKQIAENGFPLKGRYRQAVDMSLRKAARDKASNVSQRIIASFDSKIDARIDYDRDVFVQDTVGTSLEVLAEKLKEVGLGQYSYANFIVDFTNAVSEVEVEEISNPFPDIQRQPMPTAGMRG